MRRSRLISVFVIIIKKMPLKQGTEIEKLDMDNFEGLTIKKMPLKQGTEI